MAALGKQLNEITASFPAEINKRLHTGIDDVSRSGVAPGLAVGDVAPEFSLKDAVGNQVVLSDLLAKGPVVVTFYRGEWCPYCNLQLRALQEALPEINSTGATLVAISPQAPDDSLTMIEKHELEFLVLSDPDQAVSESYKVRFDVSGEVADVHVNWFQIDPAQKNADGRRSLPVPSMFIIDRDGTVKLASVNADFRVRIDPADVISALKAL